MRGREGGATGSGAEIPLQSVVKTMDTQVVPLQLIEVPMGGHKQSSAHRGPCATASGYTLKEDTGCGDSTLEQAPGRSCSRGEKPIEEKFS